MSDVVNDIRSLVRWVYVTCDTQVAVNVATKCKAVADSHDKLTEQNKMLREALIRVSEWDNMSQTFRIDNGSRGQQRVIVGIAAEALETTK